MDSGIPGTQTFTKPLDDNGTSTEENKGKDEPIYRIRNPRDIPKDRDRVDYKDWSNADPSYNGLGKPDRSPKTKYPYRDEKPNTHNASSKFVVGLWQLKQARDMLLPAGSRVSADLSTMMVGLDPDISQRATQCKANLKRADLKNLRWIFAVDCGNGARVVRLKAARPTAGVTNFSKMDLHVACSCPAWRWQGPEYHATRKDYQDPKTPLQGTASTPDIRDPERDNKVCKHVAAVASLVRGWSIPKPKKK